MKYKFGTHTLSDVRMGGGGEFQPLVSYKLLKEKISKRLLYQTLFLLAKHALSVLILAGTNLFWRISSKSAKLNPPPKLNKNNKNGFSLTSHFPVCVVCLLIIRVSELFRSCPHILVI